MGFLSLLFSGYGAITAIIISIVILTVLALVSAGTITAIVLIVEDVRAKRGKFTAPRRSAFTSPSSIYAKPHPVF